MSTELTTTIDIAKVLIKSGSNAERLITKTMQGEPAYITDAKRVVIGDGYTIGGYNVGNILYGIGSSTLSGNVERTSSVNSGFIYYGDTYFCNTYNAYYTLVGTNVSQLDNYQQIMTVTTGDDVTTVRNISGTLSLLPLSATSLFQDIGRAGVVVDGVNLTLGSTISTNLISYLDYTSSPFYTAIKVESSAINYYRITTNTLKFAPTSLNRLELPKYMKFGNATVNVVQSNWNYQNGALYKNASNVVGLSAVPTAKRLQFFEQPINVVSQLSALNGIYYIDFTTLSSSNALPHTLSGFKTAYNMVLFSGTIVNNSTSQLEIKYLIPNTSAYIIADYFSELADNTRSFNFFLPLGDPSVFKYSIGTAELVFNNLGITNPIVTLSAIAAI